MITINEMASQESLNHRKRWILDSGANSHICNDRDLFATFNKKKISFSVPGGTTKCIGVGTINLKVHNKVTNQYDVVVLTEVSLIEGAPNLISTGKLNKIGLHLDTVKGCVFHCESTMHVYKVLVSTDDLLVLPCVTGFMLSSQHSENCETDHLISRQNLIISSLTSHKNESEYHADIKLNTELFKKNYEKYGPFEVELFSSDTNHFLDNYVTEKQNSFLIEWSKCFFYGNPKFQNEFIYKTLSKAVTDFSLAPDLTKFLFVLPKWETAPWYKTFIDYFEIVEEYPIGSTRVFTVPIRQHFTESKTETSVDGRAFLGPLEWPVIVIYKDKFTVTGINSAMRAHLRFGHVSLEKIKAIHNSGIPTGCDFRIKDLNCACCYLTKAKRNLLTRAPKRPAGLQSTKQGGNQESQMRSQITVFGHLVFTDILYMNIPSNEGELYVVHFVDCASRYCKSYLMKTRDEIYKYLQAFIDWVKSQVHVRFPDVRNCLRIILSDRAGEYIGEEWQSVCRKNSVKYQYTNAGAHEEANVAERIWQTLQDSMRAMMCTAQFQKKEWTFAFRHAQWLYNRTPHSHHGNSLSPYEYVTGLKPDLSKVRIFGCKCYKFVFQQNRTDKLDYRSKACFYIGHHEERANTYLFYFRENGKVFEGGFAAFDENFAEVGKLLSTFDSTFVHNFEVKTKRPEPFLDVEQYDFKVKAINDADVYYDTVDNETYLVLHITTHNNQPETGIWIRASSLFKNNSRRDVFQKMNKHNVSLFELWHRGNKKKVDSMHPICKEVWVRYLHEKTEPTYMHSYIVGNDPRHHRNWSVVHISDGYSEDVREDNIIWQLSQVSHQKNIFNIYSGREWYEAIEQFNGEFAQTDLFEEKCQLNAIKSVSDDNQKYVNYREPLTYRQALKLPDAAEWEEATQKELKQFIDLKAIIPIKEENIPKGKNITESKMVYKLKLLADGSLDKYKARLVAKGFTQVYGLDFTENFSPTPMIGGVRFVIIYILQHRLKRAQGDVSGAFLNSTLKEEIYLRLPEGLMLEGSTIVKLIKSLYGLKQAARDWYELSDKIIRSFDSELKRSMTEPCVYYKTTEGCKFIISVHVDDYIMGYEDEKYFKAFIAHFHKTIKMTVKDEVDFMLQMKLEWTDNTVRLSQNRQIESLGKKFNVNESQKIYYTPMEAKLKLEKGDPLNLPDVPYRELVCSLLFIARYTRPDILFAVTLLCRFLTNYTEVHWKAAKRVLCYTVKTTDRMLIYKRNPKASPVEVYTDSDWGSDRIDGRSTSGVLILLYGNPVTWSTEKQTNVALSTSEAEYIALTSGFKEAKYFINLMQVEMKIKVTPILSRIDNIGAGYMAEQSVTNKRTKHIDLRYHFVREEIMEYKNFELQYVATKLNTADIFTKPLDRGLFETHRDTLMMLVAREA